MKVNQLTGKEIKVEKYQINTSQTESEQNAVSNRKFSESNERILPEIMNTLYRLGITANYKGYYYIAVAIRLTAENPERLLFVTKWLYPDVARIYNTTVSCIERNIRTVANIAWEKNPKLLMTLAGRELIRHPPASQLISILVQNFLQESADAKRQSFV